jgi:hypothetical protein
MEQPPAKRQVLVEAARIFGVEITPGDDALERSVDQIVEFLAEIDTLDLQGVPPASIYDPAWPRVNGVAS